MGNVHSVQVVIVGPDSPTPLLKCYCLHCHRSLTTGLKARASINSYSTYQRYVREEVRKIREVFGPNPDSSALN